MQKIVMSDLYRQVNFLASTITLKTVYSFLFCETFLHFIPKPAFNSYKNYTGLEQQK